MTINTLLRQLASPKLTLALFVLFAAGVLGAHFGRLPQTWTLAVPLLLFALNLLAAIVVNSVFRRRIPLLVFHLALLALIVLVAVSRLTYLRGHVELTDGETFRGRISGVESGPLHPWHLDREAFTQGGFTINYDSGIQRDRTRSRVEWIDSQGRRHVGVIGDQHPLVLGGYRFYTTYNKGFAPTFTWYPVSGGPPRRGSIHLPSYPENEYRQALQWTLPGTHVALWTELQIDERILNPKRPSWFRVPTHYRLIVRLKGARYVLKPGDHIDLPGGRLVYDGLRTWMGYQVFYDWTTPWLLAACLVAMLSLAWHYGSRFAARPWLADGDDSEGIRPKSDETGIRVPSSRPRKFPSRLIFSICTRLGFR